MTKRITVKIPRLPVVAQAAPDPVAVTFGPFGWAYNTILISPIVDTIQMPGSVDIAIATCPGAVLFVFSVGPYVYESLTGAALVVGCSQSFTVTAFNSAGAQLGPIFCQFTGA